MESFTQLTAWESGLDLVKDIYRLTKLLPTNERFGLTSQLRRASTSILANIAEGFSRRSPADKVHKYTIARGECSEVMAFLMIIESIGFLKRNEIQRSLELSELTGRLISGLIHTHQTRAPTPNHPITRHPVRK